MAERSSTPLATRIRRIARIGLDLVHVRMQMLSLEAAEQKRQLMQTIIALTVLAVFSLLGFITLLFALNTVLSEQARIIVFFGLFAFFLMVCIACLVSVLNTLKHHQPPFHDTLQEIKKDLQIFHTIEEEDE